MALSTKIIRRRIRSVGNTKKITKAMEMVAGAKMRKAVGAVVGSRSYAAAAWETITRLASKVDTASHPLLSQRSEIKRVAIIVITSSRGLCGGFNSQVVAKVLALSASLKAKGIAQNQQDIFPVGKKGAEALARRGFTLKAYFDKPDVTVSLDDANTIAKTVFAGFSLGEYDEVLLVYSDFITPLVQKPSVKQLLPIDPKAETDLGSASLTYGQAAVPKPAETKTAIAAEYLFEPQASLILNTFIPQFMEFQIYQALLESTASEHSARMLAMRNATDAASDMISGLTLMYNQARQAGITREIAEIAGGKAALE